MGLEFGCVKEKRVGCWIFWVLLFFLEDEEMRCSLVSLEEKNRAKRLGLVF
jgi:hypothetical protein